MNQTIDTINVLVNLHIVDSKLELRVNSLEISSLKNVHFCVFELYGKFSMPLMPSVVKRRELFVDFEVLWCGVT